ncbi:MAG TPA: hypothetical protein VFP09_07110, partial [Desertimonas sp.]|nr:hypothetical protein [Desertimonas sp.]
MELASLRSPEARTPVGSEGVARICDALYGAAVWEVVTLRVAGAIDLVWPSGWRFLIEVSLEVAVGGDG